jgi:hypothetical protein
MSKHLNNSRTSRPMPLANVEGSTLIKKFKLVELKEKREREINVSFIWMKDGYVSSFLYEWNRIYLRPIESCEIDFDYHLNYNLTLPAAVKIHISDGKGRICVEAGEANIIEIPLTDEMLNGLRYRFPDYVRNIKLVTKLKDRLRGMRFEKKKILEVFKPEIEIQDAKDCEFKEKTKRMWQQNEEEGAEDREFKEKIKKIKEKALQQREEKSA